VTHPFASYEVAGFVIGSALPFPDGLRTSACPVDCVVDIGHPGDVPAPAGGAWPAATRGENNTILTFAALARFEINPARDHVLCHPSSGIPPATLASLFLDHVLPRVLTERGRLVLHASAVATRWGAIGLVGETGAGKSTLAAAFALSGSPLISDDALVVDARGARPIAMPTYPSVRLWRDSVDAIFGPDTSGAVVAHYTDKVRLGPIELPAAAFSVEPRPITRVFVLATKPSRRVAIRPMRPREAFLALSRQVFRLDASDRAQTAGVFDRLSNSPLLPACRALRYPRDHARLPEVRAAILHDVAEEGT